MKTLVAVVWPAILCIISLLALSACQENVEYLEMSAIPGDEEFLTNNDGNEPTGGEEPPIEDPEDYKHLCVGFFHGKHFTTKKYVGNQSEHGLIVRTNTLLMIGGTHTKVNVYLKNDYFGHPPRVCIITAGNHAIANIKVVNSPKKILNIAVGNQTRQFIHFCRHTTVHHGFYAWLSGNRPKVEVTGSGHSYPCPEVLKMEGNEPELLCDP